MSTPNNPDIVRDTYLLINRINQQLLEKRRDIRLLTDAELLFNEEEKAFRVITRALSRLPADARPFFADFIGQVEEISENFRITLAYREQYRTERLRNIGEIERIESLFPKFPNLIGVEVKAYLDELIIITPFRIPGLLYRVRQALYSFWQQVEAHACLVEPSNPNKRYPIEVERGLWVKTRSSRIDYFFTGGAPVSVVGARYIQAFIEEINVLSPHMFIPNQYLPLLQPTEDELADARVEAADVEQLSQEPAC